jgi:hypothetical protein
VLSSDVVLHHARGGVKTLARSRDKADILQRLGNVRPQSAARWGRMTAHQMVCHLNDSLRMAAGQKAVSAATGVLQRTFVKWMALYVPVRWPAGIETRPEIDQKLYGTRPADFAADMAELQALVELVTTERQNIARPPHPIFGSLSEAAWLRWAYLHIDHHLRQFGV